MKLGFAIKIESLDEIIDKSEFTEDDAMQMDIKIKKSFRKHYEIETQHHVFNHKYGINSIKDLEHAIEKGTVVESDVFEDLTRIDYLESQLIFVRNFLHNNEIDLTIRENKREL